MENLSELNIGQKLSREIKLTGGILIIDELDFPFVSLLGMSIVRREDLCHVYINTKPYYKQPLHRVLLGITDPDIIVDHKDRNGLNNTRDNLRPTTKTGNALNMTGHRNKKSGLPKGVYRERNGYKAQITIKGLEFYLGHFDTVEKALIAYQLKAQTFWSETE